MSDKERVTCDVCGKSFDSRKQMKRHKHDIHDTNDVTKEIKPKSLLIQRNVHMQDAVDRKEMLTYIARIWNTKQVMVTIILKTKLT
ncbi:MAG: hypothetical protein WA421_07880 [Nitrososphaeraceae archaeon]|jgi:hypothetical protein